VRGERGIGLVRGWEVDLFVKVTWNLSWNGHD